MIWENLNEETVFTELDVKNGSDVFEKMGGGLTAAGYCKQSYVQALKDREKDFPTGIVVGEYGVAIPHTDPEHVNRSAVCVASLKNPVMFYHMGTNPKEGIQVPVKFVMMLAIAGTGHLEVLQQAIQLIQDQEVLKQLIHAQDIEKVIEIIKLKEEAL